MAYGTVITVGDTNERITAGFSCIEIWASIDSGATYQEITAQEEAPARLRSRAATTLFDFGGRTLRFSIDGNAAVLVQFASSHRF